MMKRIMTVASMIWCLAGSALAAQPPAGSDEFVPAGSLPPVESLPAAPMVMAAYAFVWAALLGYVWYIWRRLQKVEGELADLERRAARRQE